MADPQARGERFLLILTILATAGLCLVLVFLFGLMVNQPSGPDAAALDDETMTEEPTPTETVIRDATPVPTTPATLTATPTLTLTPLATPTPTPTRREFLEPTKPPYVFPTPIYIPPVPRERPTPTRAR